MTPRPIFDIDNPETWPGTLLQVEVAAVMRIASKSIGNAIARGDFLPLPFEERPNRWRKEDVIAWRNGEFREALKRLRAMHRRRQPEKKASGF